jgi:hypothetical protein
VTPQRALLFAIFAAVGAGFAGGQIARVGFVAIAAFVVFVAGWWLVDRRFEAQRWWRRAVNPILLESPFTQPWRVVAGGPDPRHNHHQGASDQYFAYDFLAVEAGTSESEVLAPCDGTIAWSEERRDDAWLSIETPRGFVIMAHLAKGSIAVRVADRVTVRTPLAKCASLHIHAQDRPHLAEGIAQAIPIAFFDEHGVAQVLEYGDVLQPATVASPAQNQR